MARLEDMIAPERKHIENVNCPTFDCPPISAVDHLPGLSGKILTFTLYGLFNFIIRITDPPRHLDQFFSSLEHLRSFDLNF